MATDDEILKLLHRREDKGLELMMNTYMGFVYAIVSNKIAATCTSEDIEECVSDVFYDLYKNSEKIDLQKGPLKAFLAIVAKRKAIDLYRKSYRQSSKVVSLETINEVQPIDSDSDNEKIFASKETRFQIIEQIKRLGEPDSEILIRKYFFEQPSKEISKVMGIKINTIDKKVSRALVKLKKVWEGGS